VTGRTATDGAAASTGGSPTGADAPSGTAPVHVAIRASAGSGKTFQLTGRYLRLLLAGERPERILATTFTRKAAGEILGRVLVRLGRAATSDDVAARLGEELGQPVRRADAGALLLRLASELHRLRISTIDAFFGGLARSFAPELGLPPGWAIGDEVSEETLRTRAIVALLDEDPERVLTLLRLLRGGDAGRDVAAEVARTVTELYALFRTTDATAWSKLHAPPPLSAQALDALLGELDAAWPTGKKTLDDAIAKARDAARAGDWTALAKGKLMRSVLHGDGTYNRAPVPPAVAAPLARLGDHARRAIVGRLAGRTAAAYDLLAAYDRHLRAARAAAGTLRFDEVAHALAACERLGALDDVYFRLDGRIAHLLLDEFQDTSVAQWRVLRPFAQEIAAVSDGTRSFLAVGDVKQAIYRWRGGAPEIFERLAQELPGLAEQPLDQSHRSAPVVIDTVNEVFGALRESALIGAQDEDGLREGVRRWLGGFSPHRAARATLAGHVTLRVAPAPRDAPTREVRHATIAAACAHVGRLAATLPGRSIAVLVRKNETVARVVWHLRRAGVATSEEGGTPLVDSVAVSVVCGLLRLAEHPGDETARYLVARSPLGARAGLRPGDAPEVAAAAAARAGSELRAELSTRGFGPVVYALCARMAAASDPRDARRLAQLVERAARFDAEQDAPPRVGPPRALRITEFLERVKTEKVDDPSGAGVRVMTVHQAKGLEFDVVVLPELEEPLLDRRGAAILVAEGARPGETDAVAAAPNKDELALIGRTGGVDLARLRADDRARRVRESLSLLYVALTRAVHALDLWVAPARDSEGKPPVTWATLLCEALGGAGWEARRATPGAVVAERGDPGWADAGAAAAATRPGGAGDGGATPAGATGAAPSGGVPSEEATPPAPRVTLAGPDRVRRRGLGRTSPTGRKEADRVEIARHLTPAAGAALARGTALHAMLEQVVWLDEPVHGPGAAGRRPGAAPGVPGDPALRAAALRAGTPLAEADALVDALHAMLRAPEIALALSRAPYAREAGLRVVAERELPFALREDDDVVAGSIDRLVVRYGADGRAVDAEVLDYKSDAVQGDDTTLAARVETYAVQMTTYQQAVARLFGLPPERVRKKLLFVTAGRVIALDN
jgi:ATP-dependent exoDNAse (exonuclease V) beta subunit